jgi:predicted O-methyltransferase YrrM
MLKELEKIFSTGIIEVNTDGETIRVHSNTTLEQGIFLQKIFNLVQPKNTLEVGLAYGISALFILEMHKMNNQKNGFHIAIEPDEYWGKAAIHNIEKAGLINYFKVERFFSDQILPKLYLEGYRIQYAYVDTTKRFDVVFQDCYFLDKMLDIGGVIILDDCGGSWPGVQRVARYMLNLPHYKLIDKTGKYKYSKMAFAKSILKNMYLRLIPFKSLFFKKFHLISDNDLGIDYQCLVFQKVAEDERDWMWDMPF